MLNIKTFDARAGGNVLYKALAHPLAAEAIERLAARLAEGALAVYDPDGVADALWAMHPAMPGPAEVYVHDVDQIGQPRVGHAALPLTDLPRSGCRHLLIAAFDAGRIRARIDWMVPKTMAVATLDEVRLPAEMLTNKARYLEKTNFATNYAFFRDTGEPGGPGLHTRLVTANYWAGYGAKSVRLWCRLFGADGAVLAEWEEATPSGAGGIAIDSQEVRARFGLPAFTGQLFIHALGAAGHDVVKYALDTYGTGGEQSLSCTHDANAWPSDRYAGMPAPRQGERVVLWLQNSHAAPIPAGAVALDRMGAERPAPLERELPGYASTEVDVAELLPGVEWPAQVEVRAGRHVVRPRYEVMQAGRTRIAHLNVERADLKPNPEIKSLHNLLGRGYLLPFPVLPPDRFRSIVLPTPMAESQANLPLRLDVFGADGRKLAERFLGNLPRDHALAVDLEELGAEEGHAELVYDFRDGGEADGWMHCLMRYEHKASGHAAESSFGGHIYNTAMTYRDEPQSYSGPPPGLSTRLFLKLGDRERRSFAALIYAASAPWHAESSTTLLLHDSAGEVIAERPLRIACSGSAMVFPHAAFGDGLLEQAGPRGYVLIRDTTCRLFGYHGLMEESGAFSLDHMFGF
ncbi:MAG TPA: hypothetical protein VE650_21770 [Acetobacteraceae bacterium]|nr:hypothetical protein [Acetobacteraceae bacterium]